MKTISSLKPSMFFVFLCLFAGFNYTNAQSDFPVLEQNNLVAFYNLEGNLAENNNRLSDAVNYNSYFVDGQFCESEESSVYFEGEKSCLKFSDMPSINPVVGFTLSFVVNMDAYPSSETVILSCSDSLDYTSGSYWVSVSPFDGGNSGSAWSFNYIDGEGELHSFTSEWGFFANSWIPHTITYDGNMLSMYMDAEPVFMLEHSITSLNTETNPVWLGNAVTNECSGKIDYFFQYDRALDAEEIAQVIYQYLFWQDPERNVEFPFIQGEDIELIASISAPFLNYTFSKGSTVLQQGTDSIYVLENIQESDIGTYTCVATNCRESSTKTFELVNDGELSTFEFTGTSGDVFGILGESLSIRAYTSESSTSTYYNWYKNGVSFDNNSSSYNIESLTLADTGYYYCKAFDNGNIYDSDLIYVGLKTSNAYPIADFTGLKAFYSFNGNYKDSIGLSGPANAVNTSFSEGIFLSPKHAVSLNNSEALIEITHTDQLNFNDSSSLTLVLQIDAYPSENSALLSKSSAEGDTLGNYSLFISPEGYLSFGFRGADAKEYTCFSEVSISTGRPHIVSVYVWDSYMAIIIDHDKQTRVSIEDALPEINTTSLLIGEACAFGAEFKIDEFRLYGGRSSSDCYTFYRYFSPKKQDSRLEGGVCPPDSYKFSANATGPYVSYKFYNDDKVFYQGDSSSYDIWVDDEDDFGVYYCETSNTYDTVVVELTLGTGKRYDNIEIYPSHTKQIFYTEGEEVRIAYSMNSFMEGLRYEMYHNGILLSDVPRNILTIPNAGPDHIGKYYFVVYNGCERLVSDTVRLIMNGMEYQSYDVPGWDWTTNISGTGSSYFSSITKPGADGSFYLLCHFSGGLKVGDDEYFSSLQNDILILKYRKNGNYHWSKVISGGDFKGKGDLDIDPDGNLYFSGSFRNSVTINNVEYTTQANTGCAYVGKLDSLGTYLWVETIESQGAISCMNINASQDGGAYIAGNFEGESLTTSDIVVSGSWGDYTNSLYVAKIDPSGAAEWIKHAVTDDIDMLFGLTDMVLNSNNEIIITGTAMASVDFGDGITSNNEFEAPFLAAYNTEGTIQWAKAIIFNHGFGEAFDVSTDEDERIYITGMHIGDISIDEQSASAKDSAMEEIYWARFNSSGICEVLRSYGSIGDGADYGMSYEPIDTASGYMMGMFGDSLLLAGDTLFADPEGTIGYAPNMFICKMSSEGEPLKLESAGIRNYGFNGEIVVGDSGRTYFAGLTEMPNLKKSINSGALTLAFAGYREETSSLDTTGSPASILTKKINDDSYLVFPNPSNSLVSILSQDGKSFKIEVYTLSGRKLQEEANRDKYTLNVSSFTRGAYILKISSDRKTEIRKIIVQ